MEKFRNYIPEADYADVRKYLKKLGKGKDVTFVDNDGKTKQTGKFNGLMRRGPFTYAKVEHGREMSLVPLPQIMTK